MCGILVIRDKSGVNLEKAKSSLGLLNHRGPDNIDFRIINKKLFFGHVRLSILDVVETSNQPYGDKDLLVFNGEIYNYIELSKQFLNLSDAQIKGDTQVLFELLQKFGHRKIKSLNGDWSFAFYNSNKDELLISRDRFGAKPLYVYSDSLVEIYSSEIKPILYYVDEINFNRREINKFINWGNPRYSPVSWFENIVEFPPGNILKISEGNLFQDGIWSYKKKKSKKKFKDSLENSILIRLRSDVGYSVTLSSGIDSNYIFNKIKEIVGYFPLAYNAAFPKKNMSLSNPLYTTNVSSESEKIKEIYKGDLDGSINYLNFNNIKIIDQLKRVIYFLEEGHPSPAILPLYSLYKSIGEENKVVIDGQGSDEVLLGYFSHVWPIAIIRLILKFQFCKAYELWISAKKYYSFFASIKKLILSIIPINFNNNINYSLWDGKLNLKRGSRLKSLTARSLIKFHHVNTLRGLLKYGDRLSMASSVESRNPFIDHNFVISAIESKFEDLFNDNVTKIPLRNLSKGIVSSDIIHENIKKGFPTPLKDWIDSDFDKINSILLNGYLIHYNFYTKNKLKKVLNNYKIKGKSSSKLWRILSAEIWFMHYEKKFNNSI